MSHLTTVKFNTYEKPLSTDQNNLQKYLSRDVQRLFQAIYLKKDSDGIYQPQSGFLEGFNLVYSSGLNAYLTAGFGFQESGGDSEDASSYKFFENSQSYLLTFDEGDASYPRIDLVEVKHALQNTDMQMRHIWDINSSDYVETTVYKKTVPSCEIAIKKGTPAAEPTFPSVDSGYIAAWYVVVPAGATTLNESGFLDARHFIIPRDCNNTSSKNGMNLVYSEDDKFIITDGYVSIDGNVIFHEETEYDFEEKLARYTTKDNSTWYYIYFVKPSKIQKGKKYEICVSTVPPNIQRNPIARPWVLIYDVNGLKIYDAPPAKNYIYLGSLYISSLGKITPFARFANGQVTLMSSLTDKKILDIQPTDTNKHNIDVKTPDVPGIQALIKWYVTHKTNDKEGVYVYVYGQSGELDHIMVENGSTGYSAQEYAAWYPIVDGKIDYRATSKYEDTFLEIQAFLLAYTDL